MNKNEKAPADGAGRRAAWLPPIKRYVNAVEWHLHLPLALRARVMSDFSTSILVRHEAGESYEAIMESLGSPRQAAGRLLAELDGYGSALRPSRWRWAFLALALAAGAWMAVQLFWLAGGAHTLGVIGGADGPTAVYVTGATAIAGPAPAWLGPALGALACAVCAGVFWHMSRRKGGRGK